MTSARFIELYLSRQKDEALGPQARRWMPLGVGLAVFSLFLTLKLMGAA